MLALLLLALMALTLLRFSERASASLEADYLQTLSPPVYQYYYSPSDALSGVLGAWSYIGPNPDQAYVIIVFPAIDPPTIQR